MSQPPKACVMTLCNHECMAFKTNNLACFQGIHIK